MPVKLLQEWFGDEEERTLDAACYILADGSGPIIVEGPKSRVEVWDTGNSDLDLKVTSNAHYCVVRNDRTVGYYNDLIEVVTFAQGLVA